MEVREQLTIARVCPTCNFHIQNSRIALFPKNRPGVIAQNLREFFRRKTDAAHFAQEWSQVGFFLSLWVEYQREITAEQNFVSADDVDHCAENIRRVQQRRRGGIVENIGRGGAHLGHQFVKRKAAAPMREHESQVGQCLDERVNRRER